MSVTPSGFKQREKVGDSDRIVANLPLRHKFAQPVFASVSSKLGGEACA
ncbi:hypothetical protein H6S82_02015 [Planktothrix sp. FACHB-1355]|uniref:Uncharacterized protein n=1 Tax=Aerosakkonema funiforme FACHB-1375 TaxID=2949571 RepID=A0A926VB36_9CYAN|nr:MULTISPECIES: hypothetical protein [Oscillatoriales]MBD2180601.1 hypothetical protein [Aerosakkonema funiforme FACHB-1375]MBD3557639.1 hypothetical protein [Planktothrix sp. FACHB-1355]